MMTIDPGIAEMQAAAEKIAAMDFPVSIGAFADMQQCAAQWVTPLLNPPEEPDAVLASAYDNAYPAYAQAHAALRPVWRTMARSRGD